MHTVYLSICRRLSAVYLERYIRTKIFLSCRACITNVANVQRPPRTMTVPLNNNAPVNPPFSLVTSAPAIGVPVSVLPSANSTVRILRK